MCVHVCNVCARLLQNVISTTDSTRPTCIVRARELARMRRALMGALLLWLSAPSFTFPHSSFFSFCFFFHSAFFFILLLSRHPCRVRSMNQRRRGRRHGGSLGATRSFRWVSRASHCTPACACGVVSVAVSVHVHVHVHVPVPVTVVVAVVLGVCLCICVFIYVYGCMPRPSQLQRL
jgi:hypothetical protein